MKRIILFIFLVGFVSFGFSQIEFRKPFKVIPAKVAPKKNNAPKIATPEVPNDQDPFAVVPKVDPKSVQPILEDPAYSSGQKPEPISMIKKNEFDDPAKPIIEKMSKDLDKSLIREGLKEDSRYLVKVDVNFGDIRTKSEYFVIKCRDFGQIDGDLIKATLNDQIIRTQLFLNYNYQEFRVNLKNGINIFELEALNRGSLGGNTAEFHIFDDKGVLVRSDYWENWDTGVKGKFIIVKE